MLKVNFLKYFFSNRFSLLINLSLIFIITAFILRLSLYFYSIDNIEFSIFNFLKIFIVGLFFDLGSLLYLISIYLIYILLLPNILIGKTIDRIINYVYYFIFLSITFFSFMSEIPFWMEYERKFNFIAVDYLLFTYEVFSNINEYYPLPIIVSVILFLVLLSFFITRKNNIFKITFSSKHNFYQKLATTISILFFLSVYHFKVENKDAEQFENIIENEITKSGIYSFFEAYNSNEINYHDFYLTNKKLDPEFKKLKEVKNIGDEKKPNVILILLESFNADFMSHFGNLSNLSPTIDSISKESIFFTNMYAVGTRTIRGLEAVTLSIPPTPGRSIIKRKNTNSLFNIGNIFEKKGYDNIFFYGGDGYFDNMNLFLGNNNFKIVDRQKKHRVNNQFKSERIKINDEEVSFENAWGVCDEDLLNKVLKISDKQHEKRKPFFNLVMTGSNHQPYTYPEGKIDIPSGKNRAGAIKYSDYALSIFFNKAKKKKWFNNTIFILMSDHCAYSAGKTELNIKSHHIPAMIFNLNEPPKIISKLSSQIDIFPTLFSYLNWSYSSLFYGKDINENNPENERAFISNHRKLGLLKNNKFMMLGTKQRADLYNWNSQKNELKKTTMDSVFLKETVQYYQSAYELYKSGGLNFN